MAWLAVLVVNYYRPEISANDIVCGHDGISFYALCGALLATPRGNDGYDRARGHICLHCRFCHWLWLDSMAICCRDSAATGESSSPGRPIFFFFFFLFLKMKTSTIVELIDVRLGVVWAGGGNGCQLGL